MGALRHIAALAVVAGVGLVASACGGGDEGAGGGRPETSGRAATATAPVAPAVTAAPPRSRPRPSALPGLPAFTAGFQGWDRLNAEPIPPDSAQTRRVGFDAHRGTKDVYVSVPRERLTPGGDFPDGTILVKAARTGGVITLAAIMRKIQGVDPAHGDWAFTEYKRDGPDAPFATTPALTGPVCWSCHRIAEGTDWVFTPLDP